MAAIVLESVAVPRPSAATPRVAPPPPPPRMAVTASCRLPLPECRGLRIAARPSRVSSPASFMNSPRRRCRFVCEASETTVGKVPDVTQETWKAEVLESKLPVLVEFWAPWCGPCRMILPVLEELSETYAGKLKCLKLNTDDWPDVASEHGIRSIPTVMLFYGGEKRDSVIGAVPKSTLTSYVEKYL